MENNPWWEFELPIFTDYDDNKEIYSATYTNPIGNTVHKYVLPR